MTLPIHTDLMRIERLIARALTSSDPVGRIRRAARDPSLPAPLREGLRRADAEGLRRSAALIERRRFERLLRASPLAEAWYERDAEDFTAAFGRYHREVPPTAFFGPQEAALFRRWLSERGIP